MNYPEDKIYLRLNTLITELKSYAKTKNNLEIFAYLTTIQKEITRRNDINYTIITERFLMSEKFSNEKCFKDHNQNIKAIVREWKLNQIIYPDQLIIN